MNSQSLTEPVGVSRRDLDIDMVVHMDLHEELKIDI